MVVQDRCELQRTQLAVPKSPGTTVPQILDDLTQIAIQYRCKLLHLAQPIRMDAHACKLRHEAI